MEKINRELLIKEISSRLPYGIKAQVLGWNKEKGEVEVPLRVYSINTDGYVYFESNDYDVDYVAVDNCLLFLRPMSSMAEEERAEMGTAIQKDRIEPYGEIKNFGEDNLLLCTVRQSTNLQDWLNAHHFDYRGLIEKGLALEAPEGMYKN